ncbi:glucose-6-phosphate 1-dehydrogenase [Skermanella aerolata]|uniref:Glucose-6-phosphate 1-dehydrogenase n=1 Tax=Skermanella aerolata TaxID=393310 RepID=A0A512DJK8_9PROT|nr:glucose-6-phosphate dehydrogenase [Skermanella aerolata]KJB97235.1 glucose-6-phosphate 1-dehydrogenase [Skermanella aerolata KACC 11604]GEO36615.1 glucose-6-phosphate 1-dehydrogenase [Skermanella aerolata]
MTSHTAPVETFDYLVFGGTGDLALRKLLPALYLRDKAGQITPESRILGVSRSQLSPADYKAKAEEALRRHLHKDDIDETTWGRFIDRIDYVAADATATNGWDQLQERLGGRDEIVRVFYLATSPELFGPISERLQAFGLVTPKSRVVLEKPIGHDLESARQINDEVGSVFAEEQIYRIDHYLGKETVQNLLALRFANSLFEPVWDAGHVDHVQITVAETVGVEGRGGYYDTSGALRDMVQNHLMQLLCLVGMEPPVSLDQESVRDEKIKVLRSLKPIGPENVAGCTVRGQYRAGAVEGAAVGAYAEEAGTAPGAKPSNTETFVALKVEIENWRWSGVPFYLRTGKRMPAKVSEIVIQFRQVPHSIFPKTAGEITPNLLIVRLQPDESIRLNLMAKDPGPGGMRLREASLNLSFAETFKFRFPDAYERLLMDVVRGNPTLFMRRDEVEAAWRWTESILDAWEARGDSVKPYIAGTWGPSQSVAMIERDGRTWHDDAMSNG